MRFCACAVEEERERKKLKIKTLNKKISLLRSLVRVSSLSSLRAKSEREI